MSSVSHRCFRRRNQWTLLPRQYRVRLPMSSSCSKAYDILDGTDLMSRGDVLNEVCRYLNYNYKSMDLNNVEDMELDIKLVLQTLIAADYLQGTS